MKKQKEPAYNYREILAITTADRVVARTLISGEWRESTFERMDGETVLDCLERVSSAVRHLIDRQKFAVYLENPDGLRANVPTEFGIVPVSVRDMLPTHRKEAVKKR